MIQSIRKSDLISVLFKDGTMGKFTRNDYHGACFTGDTTVYVHRKVGNETVTVWIKPGTSMDWIEA